MMTRPSCLDIFDLAVGASLDELKSAYRDLVNVWHPDRWAHNPRLQKKAERKLQQLNTAYAEARRLIQNAPDGQHASEDPDRAADAVARGATHPGKAADTPRRPFVRSHAPARPDPAGPKLWQDTEAKLQAIYRNKAWRETNHGTPKGPDRRSIGSDEPAEIRRRRIGEVVPAPRAAPVAADTPAAETKSQPLWAAAEAHLQAIAAARERERFRAARAGELAQARATMSRRLARRRLSRPWFKVLRVGLGLTLMASAAWLIFEYRRVLLGWIAGFCG